METRKNAPCRRGKGIDRRDFLKGGHGHVVRRRSCFAGCSRKRRVATAHPLPRTHRRRGGASVGLVGGAICAEDWLGEMPVVDEADVYDTVGLTSSCRRRSRRDPSGAFRRAERRERGRRRGAGREELYLFRRGYLQLQLSNVPRHGFGPYNVGDIVSEYTRRSVGRVSLHHQAVS